MNTAKAFEAKKALLKIPGQRRLIPSILRQLAFFKIHDKDGKLISAFEALWIGEQQAQRGQTPHAKHKLRSWGLHQSYAEREWPIVESQIQRHINALRAQISEGQIVSLLELASMALEATAALEDIAQRGPAFVAEVASSQTEWPVLATVGNSWQAGCAEMLKNVRLCEKFPWRDKAIKMGSKTTPRSWAVHLWETLSVYEVARSKTNWFQRDHVRDTENLVVNGQVYRTNDEVFQSLKKFPLVEKASAAELWPLAQKLFLQLTNDRPWEVDGLAGYAEADRVKARGGTDKSKRNEIVKHIRQAFVNLVKTRQRRRQKKGASAPSVKNQKGA